MLGKKSDEGVPLKNNAYHATLLQVFECEVIEVIVPASHIILSLRAMPYGGESKLIIPGNHGHLVNSVMNSGAMRRSQLPR